MRAVRSTVTRKRVTLLSCLSIAVASGVFGVVATTGNAAAGKASAVTTSSLGQFSPTFTGPAATGCASGCSLLTGPAAAPSTASSASAAASPASPQASANSAGPRALPAPNAAGHAPDIGTQAATTAATASLPLPSVSCQPLG